MGNKTIFRVVMCIIILSTFILPVSAQQPDKTNEYEVSLKKLRPEIDRSTEVVDQTRNRDQEIYDAAYALPKDSIEVADRPYNRATGTKPLLYSIERRAKDTKVTFLQPIYFDWQWLYYSPGFVIIDRKTGDEYHVRI